LCDAPPSADRRAASQRAAAVSPALGAPAAPHTAAAAQKSSIPRFSSPAGARRLQAREDPRPRRPLVAMVEREKELTSVVQVLRETLADLAGQAKSFNVDLMPGWQEPRDGRRKGLFAFLPWPPRSAASWPDSPLPPRRRLSASGTASPTARRSRRCRSSAWRSRGRSRRARSRPGTRRAARRPARSAAARG
jgi:hypothetical protein